MCCKAGEAYQERQGMKEYPMSFSAEMVAALLDGRKTQTRRIVSRRNSLIDGYPISQERWDSLHFEDAWIDKGPSPSGNPGPYLKVPDTDSVVHRIYPRIQSGDVLWVREALRRAESGCVTYQQDGTPVMHEGEPMHWPWQRKTLPSIFMPRLACRILLKMKAMRAERVQNISYKDCLAESIDEEGAYNDYGAGGRVRDAFAALWDSIHAKRINRWKGNPWVWVWEFERMP